MTCSQLSSTSTVSAPAKRSSSICSPPVSCSVSATICGDRRGRVGRLQPDQPDAAGCGAGPRTTSMAVRVLPTPAGPTSVTSRCSPSSRADGREVVGASDQRSGQRRAGCRPPGPAVPAGRRAAASRAALCRRIWSSSAPQRLPRLDAELVDEQPAHPLVGGQRVGLATGAVQGGDQGGPQAFAQRMLVDAAIRARRSPRRRRRGRPERPRWSSSRPSRTSSSRARWGWSQSPSPASTRTSPRNSAERLGGRLQRRRWRRRSAAPRTPTRPGSTTWRASTPPASSSRV